MSRETTRAGRFGAMLSGSEKEEWRREGGGAEEWGGGMRQGSKQQKSDRHSATGVVQPNPVVTLGMGGTQKQVHMAKTNGNPTNQPNP